MQKKIISIQYLRAVAALSVVGAHTFLNFGAEGVDLFFVISGFIMCYVIHNTDKNYKCFLIDRYLRIAPMYYLITIVFVLCGFSEVTSFHQVIQTITFLKYYESAPLLSIGWTLEYEFAFYSLCALAMALFKSFNMRIYFVLIILFIVVVILDFHLFAEKKYGHFAEFSFGIFIYILFKNELIPSRALLVGISGIFVSILLLYFANTFYGNDLLYLRFIGFGLPSALLLISVLSMRAKIGNFSVIQYLGDASYSIYITHTTTILSFYVFYDIARGNSLIVDVMSFMLAVAFGCLAYSYIEQPISKFLRLRR